MKSKMHLIMPMGGAGSRFYKNGYELPKPLIEINGKPFLYWATMSIAKYIEACDITFVVLQQHIDQFNINQVIKEYFPEARITVIPKVLPGAVMTCLAGIENVNDELPVLFNDCDHMFACRTFNEDIMHDEWEFDGALLTFESDEPQFSYIEYDKNKNIVGTVEKKVVSNHAICGAYVVRNAEIFKQMADEYLENCSYSEYFVSGIYNVMCRKGMKVQNYTVDFHVPFGTPEEYKIAKETEYFEEFEKLQTDSCVCRRNNK